MIGRVVWWAIIVFVTLSCGSGVYLVTGRWWLAALTGLGVGILVWLYGGLCLAAGRLKDNAE
ncbi:MAG: hypothetical protein A2Z49_09615 [Chloroflexi bacterium RBG_19FT_COMBO_56_12]|nr:MAG: hypothetical protein A2Z49_09615 [Chloroflexi bacterium RBG_19FT_COMBO_56_12]